ncbi:MAG: hypothetical protein A2092_05555 [Rhodobacteraceae bacterium GWE1_64_9]|nr:MAG: hypothetical protein A2092_05555 [Rhodobacteraceae bacterium GWE1_64_9]OHC49457.1 MAG: hypothetical protein A2X69_19895 [Rhodobacteraceae bacterium GWF1_65_7]
MIDAAPLTGPRPLPRMLQRLALPPMAAPALSRMLTAVLRRVALRHPAIFTRLGRWQSARFLIDVTDGPVLLLIDPEARRITALARHKAPPGHDAGITGSIAAFLAMLHGREDGDALFFSGALEISGDTSAVLALRNALDDAELDLTEELASWSHPPFDRWLRRASTRLARASGYALSREEPLT